MRVMVIIKANEVSEAGVLPGEKMLAEMGRFNEELVKAGVMLAGEGLHPSSKGKRVRFSGTQKGSVARIISERSEAVSGPFLRGDTEEALDELCLPYRVSAVQPFHPALPHHVK